MKRILLLVAILFVFSAQIFSQENETEDQPEDNITYVYDMNGKGDQYIKIGLMPFFPLNFGEQLYIGGAIQIGYHRFLTKWLAVGVDFMASYNPTIGNNIFYTMPLLGAVTVVPTVRKFEFPISLNVGMAFESHENKKYFPGLVLGAEASAFYRVSETWSFGIGSDFMYMPQWYDKESVTKTYGNRFGTYDYGLFITASAFARYHF